MAKKQMMHEMPGDMMGMAKGLARTRKKEAYRKAVARYRSKKK